MDTANMGAWGHGSIFALSHMHICILITSHMHIVGALEVAAAKFVLAAPASASARGGMCVQV